MLSVKFLILPLILSRLPLLTIRVPVLMKPLPSGTTSIGVLWFAIIVPVFVMPIGLESPMLPDPWMVLLLVSLSPVANARKHVFGFIVTCPEPARVVEAVKPIQLPLLLSTMVPVLLMVPFVSRLLPPVTVNSPALVGMLKTDAKADTCGNGFRNFP